MNVSVIQVAEEAARRSGEILRVYWRNLPAESVVEKARNDFVSRADRESEVAIAQTILRAFPEDGILGEEGGSRPGASGREWIVDPLDGTSNFIAGFPFWGISIGVREGEKLVAAAIWDPLREEMYCATRGGGAFRNGQRLGVTRRPGVEGAFVATGFPFRSRHLIDNYLAVFKVLFLQARAIRRAGSAALDLAHVAAGVFDGFFEFHLAPWDVAAGALLIEEAGGIVRDFGGGSGYMRSGDIVAGAPGVVEDILRAITACANRR